MNEDITPREGEPAGEPVQMVPSPVPVIFTWIRHQGPQGHRGTILAASTPVGTFHFFIDPETSVKVGHGLVETGEWARLGGLVIPDTIPPEMGETP